VFAFGSPAARLGVLAVGALALAGAAPQGGGVASPVVVSLLARYRTAIDDAGTPDVTRYIASGTLSGDNSTGNYESWRDGDRERDDQLLGLRSEEVLTLGDRVYLRDSSYGVRELRGVLYRRALTERFIDDGTFARSPDCCIDRGTARLGDRLVDVLDVVAPGGQTETLDLDARTALPARVAYDDDDGRTTIDYDDWRSVQGHRFAFRSVVSNGDRAFDVTQTTTNVQVGADPPAGTFAIPVARSIDMAAPDTVPLTVRENHLFATVTVAGQTFSFLVDTGAGNILVDESVARAIGLKEEGAFEASGATRTGGIHAARLADLAIGSGHLHDLVVSTVDLGGSTAGTFHIDGILGYPFFVQSVVKIDVANRTMTFGPPGSIAPSGTELRLDVDRALPEATLRLNGSVDGQFVVDTGDAAEMLIYRPFLDRNPGLVPFTTAQRQSYGLGGGTSSYRTAIDQLSIGGIPLYHADVDVMLATSGAFADRFSAGNIGLGILKNFVVTLDEANAKMYVEKSAQFDDGRYRYR
jgi:hypothetical protein